MFNRCCNCSIAVDKGMQGWGRLLAVVGIAGVGWGAMGFAWGQPAGGTAGGTAAGRVEVVAERVALPLATPVELTFRGVRSAGHGGGAWEVPAWGDSLPNGWEVLRVGARDTVEREGSEWEWSQAIEVITWDSGAVVFPPLPFVLGGDTVWSEALELEVAMPHGDDPGYQAPPAEVVEVQWTVWERVLLAAPLLGGVLAAVAAGWVALWAWRRRQRRPIETGAKPAEDARPAHLVALAELERIQREAAWRLGDEKGFHAAISHVLRRYIEQAMGFPAIERTTTEIRQSLPSLAVSPADRMLLMEVLEQADLAKFAKQRSGPELHERMVRNAMRFVEHTATSNAE